VVVAAVIVASWWPSRSEATPVEGVSIGPVPAWAEPLETVSPISTTADDRDIVTRGHGTDFAPQRAERRTGHEWVWDLHDVEAVDLADGTPAWFDLYPWVQVTDFSSWGEVVRWAHALFQAPEAGRGGLAEIVSRCAAEGDREARALCAIHFVQDDIRYLGLEIGPNSHQPHDPGEVLAQRFGDCKDKSLLLTVLLRELDLEARPALVSTSHGRALDDWLPTPNAFNHAIVRLDLPDGADGAPIFIDATHSLQRGRLATMAPPTFERALVVDDGVSDLEVMPAPSQPSTEKVVERYQVPRFWEDGDRTLFATLINDEAPSAPSVRIRQQPLAVDHPLSLEHEITVELPFRPPIRPNRDLVESPAFRFERRQSVSGRTLVARSCPGCGADSRLYYRLPGRTTA
jgi:transglutaminase-like putative cysteine protease